MDESAIGAAVSSLEGALQVVELLGSSLEPGGVERLIGVKERLDALIANDASEAGQDAEGAEPEGLENVQLAVGPAALEECRRSSFKTKGHQDTVAKMIITDRIQLCAHTLRQRTVAGVHLRSGVIVAGGGFIFKAATHFPFLMIRPGSSHRTAWDMSTALLLIYVAAMEPRGSGARPSLSL